jgi:hypothetical protein
MKRNTALRYLAAVIAVVLYLVTRFGGVVDEIAALTARPQMITFLLTMLSTFLLATLLDYCFIALWGDAEPEPELKPEPEPAKRKDHLYITSHW